MLNLSDPRATIDISGLPHTNMPGILRHLRRRSNDYIITFHNIWLLITLQLVGFLTKYNANDLAWAERGISASYINIYLVYRELCHLVQHTCPIVLPLISVLVTFNLKYGEGLSFEVQSYTGEKKEW